VFAKTLSTKELFYEVVSDWADSEGWELEATLLSGWEDSETIDYVWLLLRSTWKFL